MQKWAKEKIECSRKIHRIALVGMVNEWHGPCMTITTMFGMKTGMWPAQTQTIWDLEEKRDGQGNYRRSQRGYLPEAQFART
jgi:hypothetical protein